VFAKRMMKNAADEELIPHEIFSKKGSHTVNAIMCKTFFCDISKVLHWPAGLGGCNFGDCYDRGAHLPGIIASQVWGISIESVKVLLIVLKRMQFCLRMGFGELKEFYGGSLDDPIFGFGQGNGTPPAFLCLSLLIMNVYQRMDNGANMTSTYTCRMFLLSAVMYVDNTDLLHLAPSQEMSDEELITQVEESTKMWGELAQVTGGALKQSNWFIYFIPTSLLVAKPVSKRSKISHPQEVLSLQRTGGSIPSHISVTQPDGSTVPIPTLEVDEPSKMLGIYFCPAGDGTKHVTSMTAKGASWLDRL